METRDLRDWAVLSGACAAAAYVFALGRLWPTLRAWGQFIALVACFVSLRTGRKGGRSVQYGLLTYATWLAVYAHVPPGGSWAWAAELWSVLLAILGLTSYNLPNVTPAEAAKGFLIVAGMTVLVPAPSAGPANAPPWHAVLRSLVFASAWQMNALWQGRAGGSETDGLFLPVQTLWILTSWVWAALLGGAAQAVVLLFLVLRDGGRHAA